ncbi:MAG: class I SAM-dependent methyltransferase [Terracidiphilus sp.]
MSPVEIRASQQSTRNNSGYLQFGASAPGTATTEDYACNQHAGAERVATDYLIPFLQGGRQILDVGCGVGALVNALVRHGFDAYGVDVPAVVPEWKKAGNDTSRFFCGDAAELPFVDESFDAVTSLGVIEHIGTVCGHYTLREDYRQQRRSYAQEILRVTRPGGKIIIACPNKCFPIDIQHGTTDEFSPRFAIRSRLFNKTGMNIHPTWGKYYLASYREVRQLFAGVRQFTPLPLKGYFGFERFSRPPLRPLLGIAQGWIDHMPSFAASSWLNPYVMVMMTK